MKKLIKTLVVLFVVTLLPMSSFIAKAEETHNEIDLSNCYKVITKPATENSAEEYAFVDRNTSEIVKTVTVEVLTKEKLEFDIAKAEEQQEKLETKEEPKVEDQKLMLNESKTIFLAPSSQFDNLYSSGLYTEGEMMNVIMDLVQVELEKYENLTILRNDRDKYVTEYIQDSLNKDVDLYFSLHSNGSDAHTARGPLVICNPENEVSVEWAEHMYEGVLSLYPEKELGRHLTKNAAFYEMYMTDAPSIIIELAFHDQPDDEAWILENKEAIAKQLADDLIIQLNK